MQIAWTQFGISQSIWYRKKCKHCQENKLHLWDETWGICSITCNTITKDTAPFANVTRLATECDKGCHKSVIKSIFDIHHFNAEVWKRVCFTVVALTMDQMTTYYVKGALSLRYTELFHIFELMFLFSNLKTLLSSASFSAAAADNVSVKKLTLINPHYLPALSSR